MRQRDAGSGEIKDAFSLQAEIAGWDSSTEQQTLMIVDDSELNRMMLMDILGDQYHYIEATDGRQAIRMLEKDLTVDLMLLDIHMPEMDGFQVLEQMDRFRWIKEVPVIMISAEERKEATERAYMLGVTDFIRRPFDAFIVRHRVENTLRLYANQKRLMNLVSAQIYEKEESNDPVSYTHLTLPTNMPV